MKRGLSDNAEVQASDKVLRLDSLAEQPWGNPAWNYLRGRKETKAQHKLCDV